MGEPPIIYEKKGGSLI